MFFSRCFFSFVIFQIMILLGCSTANLREESLETPAQILTYTGAPPIHDQRPRFREIFCGLINENSEAQKRQILFYDQVIPGASLLGYINLDHWAVALPVKEKTASDGWAAVSNHPHVRALLFEAMILFLVEKIGFFYY